MCTVSGDVGEDEVVGTLESALQEIGKEVDVLINCAGITHTATMIQTPNRAFQVSSDKGANDWETLFN